MGGAMGMPGAGHTGMGRNGFFAKSAHENPFHKTSMCKRFTSPAGCSFGDKCNFAHGPEELRQVHAPGDAVGRHGGRLLVEVVRRGDEGARAIAAIPHEDCAALPCCLQRCPSQHVLPLHAAQASGAADGKQRREYAAPIERWIAALPPCHFSIRSPGWE